MTKKSLIFSIVVLVMALVVCVVGVTAAWFGNTTKVSRVMEVTSAQPSGNATIVVESGSDGYLTNDKILRPATLRPGLGFADGAGLGGYDNLTVPYTYYAMSDTEFTTPLTVDTDSKLYNASTNADGPVQSAALAVTMTFDFTYGGEPLLNTDGTTLATITMTSATLENPRTYVLLGYEEVYDGTKYLRSGDGTPQSPYLYTASETGTYKLVSDRTLPNYVGEFALAMSVSCSDSVGSSTLNPPYASLPHQEGQAYYTRIKSGPIYSFTAIIYFGKVDEETAPELKNTRVFLNFELTISR